MATNRLQLLPPLADRTQLANILNLTIEEVNKFLNTPSTVNITGTFNPRGAYDNSTDYIPGDVVSYQGSSYIQFSDAAAGTLPTNASYWMVLANSGPGGPPGLDGANGKTLRNGPGTPSSGTGIDGDFYMDTTNELLYGPKTSGIWGIGISLVGTPGIDGISGAGMGELEDLGDRFTGINIHDLGTRV